MYRAEISFLPEGAAALVDSKAFSFGIRTLEMPPIADDKGERRAEPGRYNWTFFLNGRPVERARTRWPQCTGAIMYKLNDPYPAASWSTVDWYGTPKIAAYYVARSFAPLTAVVRLDKTDICGEEVALPVFLLYVINRSETGNIFSFINFI